MRMVTCGCCGGQVCSNADCCPKCGNTDITRGEYVDEYEPVTTCNVCKGSGIYSFMQGPDQGRGPGSQLQMRTCSKCNATGKLGGWKKVWKDY